MAAIFLILKLCMWLQAATLQAREGRTTMAQMFSLLYISLLQVFGGALAFQAPLSKLRMSSPTLNAVVQSIEPTGFPFKTPDPFLFCVYHVDNYPAGDEYMQAPRRGNGADFDPGQSYRMYHGDRIPGFPQHPHKGFETITATIEGLIDHCDSM